MCISWCTNRMTLRNARCNDKDNYCQYLQTPSKCPYIIQTISAARKLIQIYIKIISLPVPSFIR